MIALLLNSTFSSLIFRWPRHERSWRTGARHFLVLAVCSAPFLAPAQDRLKTMPGYERFQQVSRESTNAFVSGAITGTWTNDSQAFDYDRGGKRLRFDIATRLVTELPTAGTNRASGRPPGPAQGGGNGAAGRPARGRQFTSATSPDGRFKAVYHDRNLWLTQSNSTNEIAITTDGAESTRIKSGTASWVYGEELFQTTAIWWSSNSAKVAFYRFDEGSVKDFYLTLNQVGIQSTLDTEPYVKTGASNPVVDILIYDVATKTTVRVDVRDGHPFDNDVVGHYVYGISWRANHRELLFHRTNRRQNVMELCAADPTTGKCRVIVREEWPASWTENSPEIRFLADERRFIWTSERSGWRNYYLYDLDAGLVTGLTRHDFETAAIIKVDERAGALWYTAHDGDNPLKLQLHRVGLDGRDDRRVTDPAWHHTVDIAPDGRHFIDVAQTLNSPPVTRVVDVDGRLIKELAASDVTKMRKLGLKPVELLRFKAADGVTELFGTLHFPSNFQPNKKYPLLVTVYAGPGTVGARETFALPNSLTEFGFLVATFDSRSASGRGKRFLDAIYLKLGQTEIDDQAAGVKSLWNRRYVDRKRVGIFGTSYGGTVSATAILRYPDVFQAAVASSAVTDYRNYDSIYAERYMWIPQENATGYDAAAVMTHAKNLKGHLMIYYGTADNNVHPSNSLQLIRALQREGKSFEVQVGPDLGHTSVNRDRMMEFFIGNLGRR